MLYQFLSTMYFDELYDLIFVRSRSGSVLPWKVGDGKIIDGLGPTAFRRGCLTSPATWVRLQTGYLYHYAFAMLSGWRIDHLVHVRPGGQ